jgi:hypothetical protein
MHSLLIGLAVAALVVWLALFLFKVAFRVIHLLLVVAVLLFIWGVLIH